MERQGVQTYCDAANSFVTEIAFDTTGLNGLLERTSCEHGQRSTAREQHEFSEENWKAGEERRTPSQSLLVNCTGTVVARRERIAHRAGKYVDTREIWPYQPRRQRELRKQ